MSRFSFLLAVVFSCRSTSDAKTSNVKPADTAQVTLINHDGESVQVDVELALTPKQREHGLMERSTLATNHGMLFVFAKETPQQFWMKNTLIPLDMIFIRADATIAGIVADAEPLTLTGRSVDAPSLYVLEVIGGYASAHHLAAGDHVKLENVPAVTR